MILTLSITYQKQIEMIVLSREKKENIIVLSETNKDYSTLSIKLFSNFSKKDYTINLGINYSSAQTRYSKFKILNSDFSNFESGEYEYKFLGDNEVLTFGILLIESTEDKIEYDSIAPATADNDFYVYSKK